MADHATLSIQTTPETTEKLEALARATSRSESDLASEALEQYVFHQEWMIQQIHRGIEAADRGELVDDADIEAWFRSIGATN